MAKMAGLCRNEKLGREAQDLEFRVGVKVRRAEDPGCQHGSYDRYLLS